VAPGLGINNSGQVMLQNYLYSNDTLTAFPDGFIGDAINASGQVAGSESGGAAGIYANGTATALPTPKPFGLTENGWAGLGINDNGDVVVVYYGRLDIPYSSLYINGTLTGIPHSVGRITKHRRLTTAARSREPRHPQHRDAIGSDCLRHTVSFGYGCLCSVSLGEYRARMPLRVILESRSDFKKGRP
jgi:hypothetical protein